MLLVISCLLLQSVSDLQSTQKGDSDIRGVEFLSCLTHLSSPKGDSSTAGTPHHLLQRANPDFPSNLHSLSDHTFIHSLIHPPTAMKHHHAPYKMKQRLKPFTEGLPVRSGGKKIKTQKWDESDRHGHAQCWDPREEISGRLGGLFSFGVEWGVHKGNNHWWRYNRSSVSFHHSHVGCDCHLAF